MRPRTKPLGIKSFAFAKNEIAPHGEACEEAGEFPRKLYKKAGDARALGLGFSEKYEGSGGMFSIIEWFVKKSAKQDLLEFVMV
ncbi:MAG: acyl-CoA dehydrogenase family protein [Rhodospirillaceae bacterium]|nr:acyl-CoA dehydrogenase family protein [Rhodospirillaceae bacterium]MBT7731049.1 acyl-CoA dehydrogenase family protein [Rhodospirillaceae bacterium]